MRIGLARYSVFTTDMRRSFFFVEGDTGAVPLGLLNAWNNVCEQADMWVKEEWVDEGCAKLCQ